MKLASTIVTIAVLFTVGCNGARVGSSSYSVEDATSRGVLIAEYSVPEGAKLGPYEPVQVWIEDDRKLVIRLKGPHVDTEPRVNVLGLTDRDYRTIWSERDGPPYEVWLAPDPIPETIVLERESVTLRLGLRVQ